MTRRFARVLALGVLLGLAGPSCDTFQVYVLAKGSTFQRGCFAPCECPILEAVPMRGSFLLHPVPPRSPADPFRTYEVLSVSFAADVGGQTLELTGSGTYRIGGEVALLQQLTLDLSVGGAPAQHFDSGFVPLGAPFPTIAIETSVNGKVCFDTVLEIVATPPPMR